MDLNFVLDKIITVNVGNIAVKGRLKEIGKDYILIDTNTMEVYLNPDKIVYFAIEKEEKTKEGVIIQ